MSASWRPTREEHEKPDPQIGAELRGRFHLALPHPHSPGIRSQICSDTRRSAIIARPAFASYHVIARGNPRSRTSGACRLHVRHLAAPSGVDGRQRGQVFGVTRDLQTFPLGLPRGGAYLQTSPICCGAPYGNATPTDGLLRADKDCNMQAFNCAPYQKFTIVTPIRAFPAISDIHNKIDPYVNKYRKISP